MRRPLNILTGFLLLLVSSGSGSASADNTDNRHKVATFAGGCFWCMEMPFDRLDGVVSTTTGYTGGVEKNPTYRQVSAGITGHTEAVQIVYDADKISYRELLQVYWYNIDPVARNRQFCDAGRQYRSGIFYHDTSQKTQALESRDRIAVYLKQPVVTEITAFMSFYPAEDHHQDYYQKNPLRYKCYRWGCGRDQRLDELWGTKSEIR